MDDNKDVVATTPLSEKNSLKTEKLTTSNEVHVDKGIEKLQDSKDAVVTIRRKNSDKFEGRSKGYTEWFNLDSEFKKGESIQLHQTSIKTFMKIILKVKTWNRIKRFFTVLFY